MFSFSSLERNNANIWREREEGNRGNHPLYHNKYNIIMIPNHNNNNNNNNNNNKIEDGNMYIYNNYIFYIVLLKMYKIR